MRASRGSVQILQGEGDHRGARSLLMFQGVLAMVVGAFFLASLGASLYLVLLYLGVFWLLRGLGSLIDAYLAPEKWQSRGVVAIFGVLAGVMVLQAPLTGAFELSFAVVLFLGIQGVVTGGVEIFAGLREESPPQAMLGWLSLGAGLFLLFSPVMGVLALPPALAILFLLAGALTVYFSSQGFEERLVQRRLEG